MNSATFDEFGRMQANLGVEAHPPTPGAQNVTLYPYVNPQTELIDGTNLPSRLTTEAVTEPVSTSDRPISDAKDGTQIWRITHNGVDTHPIHFHLFDVQVLNRVTWDNIIIPPDANETGLEGHGADEPAGGHHRRAAADHPEGALRGAQLVRPLNPMMPERLTRRCSTTSTRRATRSEPITNRLINFGWEYVWHCHILSHEEMDMMRPVSLALPPLKPTGWSHSHRGHGNNRKVVGQNVELTWNDNSITETLFVLQRTTNGTTWRTVEHRPPPLDRWRTPTPPALTDNSSNVSTAYRYQVAAVNAVGYGFGHARHDGVRSELRPQSSASTCQPLRPDWAAGRSPAPPRPRG